MDELNEETDTKKLFLEQGNLEEKQQKELAEYLDAKNKEVEYTEQTRLIVVFLFLSFF